MKEMAWERRQRTKLFAELRKDAILSKLIKHYDQYRFKDELESSDYYAAQDHTMGLGILTRVLAYAGKTRNEVSNPALTANDTILLANVISDMLIMQAEEVKVIRQACDAEITSMRRVLQRINNIVTDELGDSIINND